MLIRFLVALVALATLPSCTEKHPVISFQAGSRKIVAELPASATTASEKDAAVFQVGGREIRVERDRILVDGSQLAKLNPATSEIRARYANSEVVIHADGTKALTVPVSRPPANPSVEVKPPPNP
ncbi:MAG: hypothetical protein AAF517_28460 [Planctomycetota bacterium]